MQCSALSQVYIILLTDDDDQEGGDAGRMV